MGRGGMVNCKQNYKKRSRFRDNSSDSDEDYVVSGEENEVSDDDSEDYCYSLDEHASEENFSSYLEEEEEEEVRKVVRSKVKKGSLKKAKKKIGSKPSQKRRKVSFVEDDDDSDDDFNGESYSDDDDEEFTLDEDESLDDEEELTVKNKKNNTTHRKKGRKSNSSVKKHKGRKKHKVSKKPTQKKGTRNRGLRKKLSYDDNDSGRCIDNKPLVTENTKKNLSRRKRRFVAPSDSDFECSESSDYDFTISEEEREQVREANELCGRLTTGSRNSSLIKRLPEDEKICMQTKPTLRKGKEMVSEVTKEVVKQVCGICLSEEDKRRIRGTLDCCSHYFCFTCINEWSKVESRCPLCKQRFKTIGKPGRSNAGIDLRYVVIQVPERDQVYQPSEEELRGYLDPYENVICTECHQGGDDNLMLLCDICDSPSHTYCVGLGREVPEGNWYCDGCRPVALGSSSSRVQEVSFDPLTDNLFNGPVPREELDLNALPSPHMPYLQGLGNIASPRFPPGDAQVASPVTGTGAATLSRRRWIRSQVQNFRSSNRIDSLVDRMDVNNASSPVRDFLNSQINLVGESSVLHPETQLIRALDHICDEDKLPGSACIPIQDPEFFPLSGQHSSIQAFQYRGTINTGGSVGGTFWDEAASVNSSGFGQQFRDIRKSSMRSDGNPPSAVEERNHFYEMQEQLQSMVKHH